MMGGMENCVYVLDTDILAQQRTFSEWYGKMTPRRQQKTDAFRFDRDKRLCLGAGILLTVALGRQREPECLFEAHGKPYLAGSGINFNLSHSGRFAACAVSDKAVGVDIQQHRHFEKNLIEYVFSSQEAQRIDECETAEQRDELCTKLWTVKESIIKYLGTGMSLAPKKIRLDFDGELKAKCSSHELGKLHFTSYDIPGYELTVCSEYEHFSDDVLCISRL